MTPPNYAPTADGSTYRAPTYLLFFDQINVAKCAADRAVDNVLDAERFSREYDTAKMWANRPVHLCR
jgi:hypothetical protein